jgi:hypothetical protein
MPILLTNWVSRRAKKKKKPTKYNWKWSQNDVDGDRKLGTKQLVLLQSTLQCIIHGLFLIVVDVLTVEEQIQ